MKKYKIQPGDTLSAIALREYGTSMLFSVIAIQNHLLDPDVIHAGDELLIPYVTFRHRFAGENSTAARLAVTERYYGGDPDAQLIWEIVNGVAQKPIAKGAWLLIPDLADVGHHTVVAGETLPGLAFDWYGDEHLARMIELANHLPFQHVPAPGDILVVPKLNRRSHARGDTLAAMCRHEYGDVDDLQTRVDVVVAANNIADPDAIVSNQVVYFPS
ncbi:LysM peptidoglycan-binding domain-containing protein [Nocardia bovistercoris]|uniref:LysM peptidoglycan-binding domain-containing protein n=1 Tax=Nocardia bovistercoris TaxID=2785916 RepID=A0A931IF01_9NOCA|nr:LysM peptidoglycan-binding domain-containing protein [Nocardia bovistercoris]MBH0779251.1 LysM peptidoglycan-binding domain-containing protein [Nocardia bovistercoris]